MTRIFLSDQKMFMSSLLTSEIFDHFLISEAVIRTHALFSVDCHLSPGFYSGEELEELGLTEGGPLPFGLMRPVLYQLIRGRHTPLSMKLVLQLTPENRENVIRASGSSFTENDITGIYWNLLFQDGVLSLTTGVGYRTFSADRDLDKAWDSYTKKFLIRHEISFEESA